MSRTDYDFSGLDEIENALSQMIEHDYPEEFIKMVIEEAAYLEKTVKMKTPVDSGHLRDLWRIGNIVKRGNEYYIEIYNNVEYAEAVEYGHRTRGGNGFVPGKHMMELSMMELQEKLPSHLKEWLNNFLNSHEI